MAPFYTRGAVREGEDYHIEVWPGEGAAQCCGERCCGRGVLLAFPSVRVHDGAKPRYTERAEAVKREIIGLDECDECGKFRDESLRCWRDIHDIQEREVSDFRIS